MVSVFANELVVEVTRRCNMHCAHCLRGDAQNMDISDEILEQIARVIRPGSIVFSGGEPSLNVQAMLKYMELAKQHCAMPHSFYVVTNGKENQMALAIALLKIYAELDEPEFCGLALSRDVFHEHVDPQALQIFEGLSFFNTTDKAHSLNEDDFRWVLNSGRAAVSGVGYRRADHSSKSIKDWVDCWDGNKETGYQVMVDTLYVSANGNIVENCDMSYEDIDADPICHISELLDAMGNYVREEEEYMERMPHLDGVSA